MNRNRLRNRQATGFFGLIAAAAFLAGTASLAQAQARLFGTLLDRPTGPRATGPPSPATQYAEFGTSVGGTVINNGGTATIAYPDNVGDYGGNNTVYIGGSSSNIAGVGGNGNGYVTMTGGTLGSTPGATALQEIIGTASCSGIFTQQGGINTPYTIDNSGYSGVFPAVHLGVSNGGYGEYDMSGGSLGVNAIFVGGSDLNSSVWNCGTGVFTQTGGSVGRLPNGSQPVQAVGLMMGGVWNTDVGQQQTTTTSSGVYTLGTVGQAAGAGGPLFVGGVECVGVMGTATFTQNSGTNAIIGGGGFNGVPSGNAQYNSAIGALLLGFYYSGPLEQKSRYVGNGVGTYNLTGGLLDGGPGNTAVGGLEIVGVSGTGTFNQSGGTNIASLGLYVGGSWTGSIQNLPTIGGSGVYTLSGGLLTTYAGGPNFEAIGQAGTGIFTQTGGTNLTATVTLSGNAQGTKPGNNAEYATPGTYNLQGGLLQTNSIVISPLFYDGGATNFNFSGGTLQEPSTGTFSSGVPITVGTTASNVATFDANGQTMSLNIGYQRYPFRPWPIAGDRQPRRRQGRPRRQRRQQHRQHLQRRHDGLVRHAASVVFHGPAQHGHFDCRRASRPLCRASGGDALRKRRRGTNSRR